MSQSIIGFIRHAHYQQQVDAPSALQPHPLSENGLKQAHACAATLLEFCKKYANHSISIHCSSLLRAWQTADIIQKTLLHHNLNLTQLQQTDALCERSVGGLANLTVSQIEEVLNADPRVTALPENWKSNSHFCLPVPGAESLLDAGERVAKYVNTTIAATSATPKIYLFVGHGASIRHAAYHLGILEFAQIRQLSMHYAKPVIFEKLNSHQYSPLQGEWKVRGQNSQFRD